MSRCSFPASVSSGSAGLRRRVEADLEAKVFGIIRAIDFGDGGFIAVQNAFSKLIQTLHFRHQSCAAGGHLITIKILWERHRCSGYHHGS